MIEDLEPYDPVDYLKSEESINSFLDDFKDDPADIKAKAKKIADRARARLVADFGGLPG